MTAAHADEYDPPPQTDSDGIPEFTSKRSRELTAADAIEFRLDGESFTLLRPKMHVAVQMLNLIEPTEPRGISQLGMDVTRLLITVMGYIKIEPPGPDGLRGRARLEQRLGDPEDGFDLSDLEGVFRELVGRMFGANPTGARPASSTKPPRKAGRGSVGGTRSQPRKTSGK